MTSWHPQENNAVESPAQGPPDVRYHMGELEHDPVDLFNWVVERDSDPAVEDFLLLLRHHLVSHMTGEYEALVPDEWKDHLNIKDNWAYEHKVISFNYPTYYMHRAQDSINPQMHVNVMLLSEDKDDENPYWYTRVVLVYHALLSFIHTDDPDISTFSFIDPATILQAAYITLSFQSGTTVDLLPSDSMARKDSTDEDYVYYCTNMFVDRNMFMQYLGGSVGHTGVGPSLEDSQTQTVRMCCHTHHHKGSLAPPGTHATSGSESSHGNNSDTYSDSVNGSKLSHNTSSSDLDILADSELGSEHDSEEER
ncbi:hypothetical protein BN946_scf184723.g1 [Trametes cinnabarina]|uniref:Uncharacterized protein n=1 Tax=Pycnoporus cinnabarinus TaxID=5643 RepID=A0A060T0E0_PYCCI|nr:hypothetical protein BN946_scf184723.g1 [Trametes cinnabarina]